MLRLVCGLSTVAGTQAIRVPIRTSVVRRVATSATASKPAVSADGDDLESDLASVPAPAGIFSMRTYRSKFLKWIVLSKWINLKELRSLKYGYHLYEKATDDVDTYRFFKQFRMPDTLFSWFLVTELHVWMICVRLMSEGEYGKITRNYLFESMWEDVNRRAKLLHSKSRITSVKQSHELSKQFRPAIIAYDEGLLDTDAKLASALWRRFLQRNAPDPEQLELLIHYVRRQIFELETTSRHKFIRSKFEWLSLDDIRV